MIEICYEWEDEQNRRVLEKIGVTQNILDRTEDDSLRVGVTKFYGPKINQAGNFCICGHNYTGILKDLKEILGLF